MKCLARALSVWCDIHGVISPAQKGFLPHDGVIEHNFLISQHLEEARRRKQDRYLAWLDISNAFGSVPHDVIINALVANGVDHEFISLVANIYSNSATKVFAGDGLTDPISIKRGVKQGCPLSGMLFNLAIDQVLRSVQDGREETAILAFADDIVLLADSQEELQGLLDTTSEALDRITLKVNPNKCATLHLSGKPQTGARPSPFQLRNSTLRIMNDGDHYKYLSKLVGFFLMKNYKNVNEALSLLQKVATSKLAPWQKLDALKTFFFPSLCFSMRTAQIDKTGWSQVDAAVTKEIKEILSLPERASNHYLQADRSAGGCGVPSAAADCDFYLVDTAFKLLTSRDEHVQLAALGQLTRTFKARMKRSPTDGDLASYLSGCMEGDYANSTNAISNTWTLARKASSRQQVTSSFIDGTPSISFGSAVVTATYRNSVMKKFHEHHKATEAAKLIALPSQGKVMECVSLAAESSHFITGGLYTRFADWRFVHKAHGLRGNGPGRHPLPHRRKVHQPSLRACRKCSQWDETLPHVLNHCKSYSAAWQLRHNAVLARIRAAVAFKGTILSENQVVGPNRLRPDLVANVDNKIYIIDVTIPFENRRQARERKVHKYLELIPYFSSLGFRHIQIVPIVVGALGAWDPENDAFLMKVATRRYLKVLRNLCVSDCIRWSRDIYIQHLTGARQYSTDAPLHPPPQCMREARPPVVRPPSVGNDTVQVNERTDSIPPVVTPSTDTPQSNASLPTNVVTPSGSENPNHIPKVPTQKTESPRATTSNDPLAGTVNSVNQSPENSPVSGPCDHENEATNTQSTPSPVVAASDVTQTSETDVAPSVVEG
ncbi:retrovirus-related Pol polyprotein from type-1 retrotransposable element R2 [Trichonephila clavipes]|nr:retrovirus-related Pol polyprotein from type-1 retrotransposable element R2 [Trichonephila clavipes]